MTSNALAVDYASLPDADLVAHARSGEREAFRHIMQRCNQRLFRVARGVLDDEAEAEDAVQDACLNAFAQLDGFRGEASLLTWMTRIVLNECHRRLRRHRPLTGIEPADMPHHVLAFPSRYGAEDPASEAARAQVRALVEHAIDALPEPFRVVFILRDVEECSIEETAATLDLRAETVKTRLHRARRLLRNTLHGTLATALTDAFPFLGRRCERMTERVLTRLSGTAPPA